jgi:hypothetical protein
MPTPKNVKINVPKLSFYLALESLTFRGNQNQSANPEEEPLNNEISAEELLAKYMEDRKDLTDTERFAA